MRFSRRFRLKLVYVCIGVALLGLIGLVGCEASLTEQDDVFPAAKQRVETNLLPLIVDESEEVLRHLLNLLTALPEICSTPLAKLGSFVSSLPALGRPVTSTLDQDDNSWEIIWRNVVLGGDAPPLTVDTTVPGVDITLTVRFLSRNQAILSAIPFVLIPQTELQTGGEPASRAAGTVEGFFLFQDLATGEWTLRWRALGEAKVFEGQVNVSASVTRVVQRLPGGDRVASLVVNDEATSIRFEETTAPADNKGFSFFIRPGEIIRFRLRIGPVEGQLQDITRDQLRIGGSDQFLPSGETPGNFTLASNLPTNPSGEPAFTPGATFIWQDTGNHNCDASTEDQWRIRFRAEDASTTFSGTVRALEDDNDAQLRVTAVGGCPTGAIDQGDRRLTYNCLVQDDTERGYDVCVTRGRRVEFAPEVDEERDPAKVIIGTQSAAPPSPYPFTILFDFELVDPQSGREFEFSDTRIFLRGTNNAENAVPLNPDQVSLDPFCSIPGEIQQRLPRVRLTGEGEYTTARFEGSRYQLGVDEDVEDGIEFTQDIDANDNPLADIRRFPDRGEIRLSTRLESELENSEILVRMTDIQEINGRVVIPMDISLNVSSVVFDFPNANFPDQAQLTVE